MVENWVSFLFHWGFSRGCSWLWCPFSFPKSEMQAPSPGAHQDISEFSQFCGMVAQCFSPGQITVSLNRGVPNLQDLVNSDLRWNWCNNCRNRAHKKWNALGSSPNHPTGNPHPRENCLSFMRPVPRAQKLGHPCKPALPSDFHQMWLRLSFTSASLSLARPCAQASVTSSAGFRPCHGGRSQLGARS